MLTPNEHAPVDGDLDDDKCLELVLKPVDDNKVLSRAKLIACRQLTSSPQTSPSRNPQPRTMPSLMVQLGTAAVLSVWKVCFLGIVGFILQRNGLFTSTVRKATSTLIVYSTTPALLFVTVSYAVGNQTSWSAGLSHLILPIFAVLHIGMSYMLMVILLRIRRFFNITILPSSSKRRFESVSNFDDLDEKLLASLACVCAGFHNGGAMPFALIESLCFNVPKGTLGDMDADTCTKTGIGYVALYCVTMSPLMWFVVPRVVGRDEIKSKKSSSELTMLESSSSETLIRTTEDSSFAGVSLGIEAPRTRTVGSGSILKFLSAQLLKFWRLNLATPPPTIATNLGFLAGITGVSKLYIPEDSVGVS
jgi:predicted permease